MLHRHALRAARSCGDRSAEATALSHLGFLDWMRTASSRPPITSGRPWPCSARSGIGTARPAPGTVWPWSNGDADGSSWRSATPRRSWCFASRTGTGSGRPEPCKASASRDGNKADSPRPGALPAPGSGAVRRTRRPGRPVGDGQGTRRHRTARRPRRGGRRLPPTGGVTLPRDRQRQRPSRGDLPTRLGPPAPRRARMRHRAPGARAGHVPRDLRPARRGGGPRPPRADRSQRLAAIIRPPNTSNWPCACRAGSTRGPWKPRCSTGSARCRSRPDTPTRPCSGTPPRSSWRGGPATRTNRSAPTRAYARPTWRSAIGAKPTPIGGRTDRSGRVCSVLMQ